MPQTYPANQRWIRPSPRTPSDDHGERLRTQVLADMDLDRPLPYAIIRRL
jgi:hypothetical protein